MYKDKILNEKGYISDVHAMNYNEAYNITNNSSSTNGIRNIGSTYWLASANSNSDNGEWCVNDSGSFYNTSCYACYGVRPIVSLTSGVYIKSGTGTESDPYILGKDE